MAATARTAYRFILACMVQCSPAALLEWTNAATRIALKSAVYTTSMDLDTLTRAMTAKRTLPRCGSGSSCSSYASAGSAKDLTVVLSPSKKLLPGVKPAARNLPIPANEYFTSPARAGAC